jgi:Flp pilus assembly protein TadB
MIIFKLMATFSVMVALYLFVVWTFRVTSNVYLRGQALTLEPHFNPPREMKELPLVSTAAKHGISFLPLVRKWRAKNRFGVAETLQEFDTELIRGGIRHSLSPEQFYAATLLSAAFLGLMLTIIGVTLFGTFAGLVFGLPCGLLVGFFLLRMLVSAHVSNRVALIEKRTPYAIEFMLLTMQANASFPMALEVYCAQMGDDDPLADEFRLVLSDINSGLSFQTAFVNLGKRIESDQLSALILAITAGLETGQPIAEILSTQADAARLRRYQTAEETAKTAATRAIFPLFVAVIAIILLLIGPMALKFMEAPVIF